MELEAFVKPSNLEEMVSLLEEQSAIVISGPSGTGKTLAALALCDVARQRNGRLDVVSASSNGDPSATRRLVENGPVLFYVEDPWGQPYAAVFESGRPRQGNVVTTESLLSHHGCTILRGQPTPGWVSSVPGTMICAGCVCALSHRTKTCLIGVFPDGYSVFGDLLSG